MGVDHDSLIDVKRVAKDDVGGFSADSCQLDEGGHVRRDFALVFFHQSSAAKADIPGLAPK